MSEKMDSFITPLGLVFTDARGQVVFVDYYFLHLVRCDDADKLIGSPLQAALGIEPLVAKQLLKKITQAGFVHEFPLTLKPGDQEPLEVLCTGVATFDDRDGFIGTDITLYDPALAGIPETQFTQHRQVLGTRIQQIQAEVEVLETQTQVQLYVQAQIGGLQILLARMGGPRIRDTLDTILSKMIAQQRWPIQMRDGALVFGNQELEAALYSALMAEVVHYSANVIGHRMVVQEMRAADGQMDKEVIGAVEPLGLRRFLDSHS